MSIYNALYGRDGHGVGPNEPEKKGFARFCQMVGRDLGQLLGTNLLVCVTGVNAQLHVELDSLVELGGGGLHDQLHGLSGIIQSGFVDQLGALLVFLASKHCSFPPSP